jgi:hypothetical protein
MLGIEIEMGFAGIPQCIADIYNSAVGIRFG